MPLVLNDRVRDTTTTTGTGSVTLSGVAPSSYQTFGDGVGNGNTTFYAIIGGSQWETGLGTYSSTGPTLSRDTVYASSAGGTTKVNFSAGTKDVWVSLPASQAIANGYGTLPVANGGTGATTASGARTNILPTQSGQSGKYLTTNGTDVSWAASIASDFQEFTSSGTWTKPTGVTWVYVESVGAGGSGSRTNSTDGAGGGGGGYNQGLFRASDLPSTVTVTVGAGGASVSTTPGNSGGDTTFGSYLTARGGEGGEVPAAGVGGRSGDGASVDSNFFPMGSFGGGAGGNADSVASGATGANSGRGGAGGGGLFGGVARNGGTSLNAGNGGAASATNGTSGSAPGGGGGAGGTTSGAGAAGRARVWAW